VRVLLDSPAWLIAVGVLALLIVALEIGFRLSHRSRTLEGAATLQNAVLALVGLLLAFSYALASDRYSLRRQLVVDEANAIGTFFLRTGFLPQPVQGEMRARVRRYVDVHLDMDEAVRDPERFALLQREQEGIQRQLWSRLEQSAPQLPTAALMLLTEALNAVIDVSAARLAAARNQVPRPILNLLVAAVLLSGVLVGYRPETQRRGLLLWAIFALLLTLVLFTLLDLDRPERGLIRTNQQPLLDLQAQLRSSP
jgi:hypothetical protein